MRMDVTESVVCSHCNTLVYRQWLVDHVQQELQSETTCRPCSDLVQMLTDLLCALHLYGHLKPPVINITCSRCSFQAGSVEKFVEHLQVSCENVAPAQDTAAAVSHASAEQSSCTYRVSYQPNDVAEGKEPVGPSLQEMADWDGQQFQKMMSTLLTDTSGKGRQKTSSDHDTGGRSKVTIDMASVCEDKEEETDVSEDLNYVGPKDQPCSTQSVKEKNTSNQEDSTDCSETNNAKDAKTKLRSRDNCNDDEDSNKPKTKTKRVRKSRAKKQQLDNLLKCHICGYSGRKREDLESHMLETHGKVEYKCNSCNFLAKSLKNLRRHQLGHQRMHECKYCQFTTRWQKNLILHERRHTGEGMIKCDQCDYVTPKKDSLLRHKVKHTGEKPFVCGQCNKTFARKGDLKQHELRHAGIKTAMCHVCGDTFFKNYELVHHIQAKHDGLKLYKCDQCTFETAYFHSLVTHGRAYHTGERPYKCDFEGCNYGSANKSQLNVHKRKHTGEKPFKCTMCNYASADNAGLRKHVRKHSSLRPYKCNMCDFDTKHSFLLRKHMETAHNVMTNCKIGRRQLTSIATTDVDSSKNQVPVDVFNQDLKTIAGHGPGQD
ncbi:zinc finger protein 260-like [Branchiostoma floridae]|uniref:Zinc finger protein 260-like n=2 Tax=Branchiostoma floridae TaxID=7739 RepID=A0A9J7HNJ4_BRAFL|nr:zinc finger protein 260-like [Branchiostoma floridae]